MKLRPAVKRFRVQRGFTQEELARLLGLSRQSLNSIENGASVPSTTIALQLARSLGCTVEDLFEVAGGGDTFPAALAKPMRSTRTVATPRVVVGSINGRWVAHRLDPRQRPRDLTVAADAVVTSTRGAEARLRPLLDPHRLAENLLIAGCDPALGLLADRAERNMPGARNVWLEATSGAALAALERSEIHIAGAHLFDEASGEYNVPFVRRGFPGQPTVVVTVAQIEEGLAVARGNPRHVRKVEHLARKGVRFINREETAGARKLLDRLLAADGIRGRDIDGYQRIAPGHLEAADAVATGAADAAMVTCSAALALGLDFVPLSSERFDLVLPKPLLRDHRVGRLLETLSSEEFRRELTSIGGYATQKAGSIAAELQ
ncbi:MAG TPA: substrate-binding domain-containing protein [Myxococcales bacterium]|nr:substrate-binding domain-containing protein [Myxococcales bacterium]